MSKSIIRVLILVLTVCMTGCANPVPKFNARYYPECYDPIDKLCKDRSNSEEVAGSVGGALLGALAGAVIGGITSRDWRGAAIGAGAGAVAGGLAGFYRARLAKIKNQEQRLAAYQSILGEKARGWDLERASIERAYKCYADQIRILKKLWREKRINREEFLARTSEIKAGIEHINTYWADVKNRMDENIADGERFLEYEEKRIASEQARMALAKARAASRAKKESISRGVQATDAQQARALDLLNDLVNVSNSVAYNESHLIYAAV